MDAAYWAEQARKFAELNKAKQAKATTTGAQGANVQNDQYYGQPAAIQNDEPLDVDMDMQDDMETDKREDGVAEQGQYDQLQYQYYMSLTQEQQQQYEQMAYQNYYAMHQMPMMGAGAVGPYGTYPHVAQPQYPVPIPEPRYPMPAASFDPAMPNRASPYLAEPAAPAAPAGKRLPAWLREAIAKKDLERRKEEEKLRKKTQLPAEDVRPADADAGADADQPQPYSRFDRSSSEGEESDGEERARHAAREKRRSRPAQDVDPEAGLDEAEKAQLMVLKVKWMLVELLREVTDEEFQAIALEVVGRRRRPPPPAAPVQPAAHKVHRLPLEEDAPAPRKPIGGLIAYGSDSEESDGGEVAEEVQEEALYVPGRRRAVSSSEGEGNEEPASTHSVTKVSDDEGVEKRRVGVDEERPASPADGAVASERSTTPVRPADHADAPAERSTSLGAADRRESRSGRSKTPDKKRTKRSRSRTKDKKRRSRSRDKKKRSRSLSRSRDRKRRTRSSSRDRKKRSRSRSRSRDRKRRSRSRCRDKQRRSRSWSRRDRSRSGARGSRSRSRDRGSRRR